MLLCKDKEYTIRRTHHTTSSIFILPGASGFNIPAMISREKCDFGRIPVLKMKIRETVSLVVVEQSKCLYRNFVR